VAPAPGVAEQLRGELERQGWVGTVAADGSMIYRSPDAAHRAPPAAEQPSQMEPEFRVMSDDEVATHSVAMKALQGPARDEYRNFYYQELRRRAQENGYWMPARPPWAAVAP
ncbi:MAG: hypothetical protein WBM65_09715, partial [Sedimenticolaceae bacterium]